MAIVDAEKARWVAEPKGGNMAIDMDRWLNDLGLTEDRVVAECGNDGDVFLQIPQDLLITVVDKIRVERDAAYASLEKLLPHKPYHADCTCRNCSDYREAKELLAKRKA